MRATTKTGAALMGHAGELAEMKEGALADLLLFDGDPLGDQSLLVGPNRMAMVMKGGRMHNDPHDNGRSRSRAAAE